MDVRIKPKKLCFFNNPDRLTVAQVREKTGADYVINCVPFDFGTLKPCMGYKCDGKVYALDDYYYGICWNTAEDITLSNAVDSYANYMTFVPAILNGAKLPFYNVDKISNPNCRTAFGLYDNGDAWLYAVQKPKLTLDELRQLGISKGMRHMVILDGGLSTCCASEGDNQTTARDIPVFLCVWEDKDADVWYKVQVGAFRSKNNAEKLKYQLKAAGYAGFVVEVKDV